MRLRHLEVFNAVMDIGSLTGAGMALGMSQSSVSKVLQHFELQLGMDLFIRKSGRLSPTPEARRLFQDSAQLVARLHTVRRVAAEKGSSLRDYGTVSGTFDQLRQRASQGKPTIVHGWFTYPGHIMVVTGYDGVHYTVNDPYGKWLLVQGSYDTTVSGKGQKYPKAAFEAVINDNGQGNDLWLHVFQ